MTSAHPIDQASLEYLILGRAVRSTHIVGHPGGWCVVFQYGTTESVLASRDGAVRIFRKFEALVSFLKKREIVQYHVDAQMHAPVASDKKRSNTHASHRMRQIHRAAAEVALLHQSNDRELVRGGPLR